VHPLVNALNRAILIMPKFHGFLALIENAAQSQEVDMTDEHMILEHLKRSQFMSEAQEQTILEL
jgi:hypothetical protein